jgi:hypothetical protein
VFLLVSVVCIFARQALIKPYLSHPIMDHGGATVSSDSIYSSHVHILIRLSYVLTNLPGPEITDKQRATTAVKDYDNQIDNPLNAERTP